VLHFDAFSAAICGAFFGAVTNRGHPFEAPRFGCKHLENSLVMEQFAKETLPVSLEEEMRRSYLDYAMSVIVGRALRTCATA